VFSFLAVFFGFYAYKLHHFSDVHGKALFLLTAGLFFWFLGETTWSFYEIFLGNLPVFSQGDIFWFIGYPMFLASLYYIWKIVLWPISKKWFVLCAMVLLVVSTLIWYAALPILMDVEVPLTEKLVTAGYVLGDMLILDVLIVVAFYLTRYKLSRAWHLIILAMALMTLADVIYARDFATYASGNLVDLLWNLSYVIFAFAFIYYREKWQDVLAKTKA